MNKNQKILLIFIGFCMFVVVGLIAFNVLMPKPEIKPDDIQVSERSIEEEAPNNQHLKKKFMSMYTLLVKMNTMKKFIRLLNVNITKILMVQK